jgi:glycosyltransferase involved in cell wall biosynthesis
MKSRILQIIPSANNSNNEKQLRLLVQGLPRDQFDVHVCSLNSDITSIPGTFDSNVKHGITSALAWPCSNSPKQTLFNTSGVPLTTITKRWKFDPRTFLELKRLVDRFQPDLIHSWMSNANIYALAAAKASGVSRFVAGYCRIDPFKSSPQLAIDRYIGRHCVQLLANDKGVRDFYVKQGLPAEKFRVIPKVVQQTQPSTVTRRQLLANLALPENSRLIGLITRLTSRHRVKDAIWAADLLKVIRKDVHLLIIGEGQDREQIRRFRDQVRIPDFVHFLGPWNDLSQLVPNFDLLWSVSPYEDPANSILEAMSAGVPVVATNAPYTLDLVLHQQTGFLVTPGDRAAVARYTHKILEDPQLADQLGQAARTRAQNVFPPDKMITEYSEMYKRLLH